MKIIIAVFLLFLAASCGKQQCKKVIEEHKNGQEMEVHIYPDCNDTSFYYIETFHSNGRPDMKGVERRNGKDNGEFVMYTKDGIIWRQATLVNNKFEGVKKDYYNNGKLKSWGVMGNNMHQGPWLYLDSNEVEVSWFKNDITNGPHLYSYVDEDDVNVVVIGNDKNGLLSGKWLWFDDGKLSQSAVYVNGVFDGEFKEYYPNGNLKTFGIRKGDSCTGPVTFYNQKGTVDSIRYYVNGKITTSK